MTAPTPTPAQPDPGPGIDWNALAEEVFGDTDTDTDTDTDSAAEHDTAEATDDREAVAAAVELETAPLAEEISDEEPAAVEPLSFGLCCAIAGVVAAVLALAGLGFIISFDTQTEALAPFFGDKAWMVPLGIDVGIVAFAALNLVLARINISMPWVRAVPGVLTAMTLYINVTAYDDLIARVAHVALPGLWIVASEVGTHVVKVRAGLAAGTRTESLGLARWLLSPVTTARLWRHMRLWGVRTADRAREVESMRLEAKAALRFRYGVAWRFAAPVQLRTAYQLRKLTDTEVYTFVPPQTADDQPAETVTISAPAELPTAATPPRPARTVPVKRTAAKPAGKAAAPRVADAEAIARLKALEPDEHGHVSIKRARAELHCGSDRAKRLLADAGLLAPEATTD